MYLLWWDHSVKATNLLKQEEEKYPQTAKNKEKQPLSQGYAEN